jgi:hypothetical protein
LTSAAFHLRAVIVGAILPVIAGATDWLQFGFDASHSSYNPAESQIASNLGALRLRYATPLPAKSDGAPVYAAGVRVADVLRDLVFVTTVDGHIVAIDAHSGDPLWMRQPATGPAAATSSSPAIDPNRLHVYSFGLDGKVHKYEIASGAEVVDEHWPEVATLKPDIEKGSSALTFVTAADGNTYLYATTSNMDNDLGDYQGHVTAIDLATGAQNVFNTLCSDQHVHFAAAPATPACGYRKSGIWGRPGVTYDAANDRIHLTTGNGSYSGNMGGNNWGESVLALTPSLLGADGHALDPAARQLYAAGVRSARCDGLRSRPNRSGDPADAGRQFRAAPWGSTGQGQHHPSAQS